MKYGGGLLSICLKKNTQIWVLMKMRIKCITEYSKFFNRQGFPLLPGSIPTSDSAERINSFFSLPASNWLVKLFNRVFLLCAKLPLVTVKKKSSLITGTSGFSLLVRRITAESTLGCGINTVLGTIMTVSGSV